MPLNYLPGLCCCSQGSGDVHRPEPPVHPPPHPPSAATNGDSHEGMPPPGQQPYRPVSATLPQGLAPPPPGEVNKAASLDRGAKAPASLSRGGGDKGDKKRHSMFGGLFKKKKDKEGK